MDKKKEQYLLSLEKKKQEKEKQKLQVEAKKIARVRYKYKLLGGITSYYYLDSPKCTAVAVTRCTIDLPYFHHGCDWVDDVGWGRGYRVLQMMCKYVLIKLDRPDFPVPSIRDIQKTLVRIGHKPKAFERSKEPIGAKEGALLLEALYDHKAKLIETTGDKIKNYYQYFDTYEGYAMLSTDNDADCRGVCGVFAHSLPYYYCLMLVDTAYEGIPASIEDLRKQRYVYWQHEKEFQKDKNYSFCCPVFPRL